MDLLLQHGADLNTQVTATKSYSMRIARAPSSSEGWTALHSAAHAGKPDLVRYLIEKGANTEIVDSEGREVIDLIGGGAAAPAAGGRGGAGVNVASAAEIRTLLQNAAAKR
jgi:ankyrin repeat protein